jgi:hypothetical protein
MTSTCAWKQPGWTCWRCFVLWTGWIYRMPRFRNGSFDSFSNSMPIMQKRFGRWISNPELWISELCSATP